MGLRPTDGGNESLLDAPERTQLHLHAGMHFIAAVGGPPDGGSRLPPARAGSLLAAMAGLWRGLSLKTDDGQKYSQLYWKTQKNRGPGDFSVCGVFTCVVYISESARNRKVVIPALTDLHVSYAVVLAGTAFITVGDDCSALSAGSGYVFLPEGPLRVEVEGSTSMLFAYVEFPELGAGAPWSAAKKRADQYCGEREKSTCGVAEDDQG